MIKVKNLNKHFNKGKQNSIHVINNTTLEFPEKGLVTLLGDSGSGKTTLLNVISGLDKAEGQIQFQDIKMNKYKSSTWDAIRANDIGFIFQNYYLLEEKTVYDNIKLVLNMIGIVDEEEVEYRITYVLNAVDMYRYKNRRASDLSGGQKQRVAIARALAKNPDVVIADEPTGNLDSKNSVEVLKIIKKISEEKLVVLVTHNKNLAYMYSDRIINIKDGKVVNDELNDNSNIDLDFVDENIYLKDLNDYSKNENIKIYSNQDIGKIDLSIVKINNNYYIKTENNENINILNNKSNIKLLNMSKDELETDHYETDFSLEELEKHQTKRVKKRTLSLKEAFIESIRKITNLGRKSKVQIFALILLGIMFSSSIHTLFSNLLIDETKIYEDKNVYITKDPNIQLGEDFLFRYKNESNFNNITFILNDREASISEDLGFLPIEAISEKDITNGRMPEKNNEILIDETVLSKNYEKQHIFNQYGYLRPIDLVNQKLYYGKKELIIVGTVKTGTKKLYFNEELYINNITLSRMYDLETTSYQENLELLSGRMPNESTSNIIEVLSVENYSSIGDEIKIEELKNDIKFVVVGIVSAENTKSLLLNKSDYKQIIKNQHQINAGEKIKLEIYALNNAKPNNDKLINVRDEKISDMKKQQKQAVAASTVQITITIAISGIIFYFLVRSSLTSRVKEISILRSLGVNKKEVITLYGLEYTIMTTVTSMIGVLLGTLMANSISNSFLNGVINLRVTPLSILVAVILMYITNIIIALIPVFMLLRKTPAEMLTTYDI